MRSERHAAKYRPRAFSPAAHRRQESDLDPVLEHLVSRDEAAIDGDREVRAQLRERRMQSLDGRERVGKPAAARKLDVELRTACALTSLREQ